MAQVTRFHLSNHANNIRKRKLDAVKKNINTSQIEPSTSHVITYNRFAILESTDDSMDVVEISTNQRTKKILLPHQFSSLMMLSTFKQW